MHYCRISVDSPVLIYAQNWRRRAILEKYNVEVIGVQVDAIERGEDRIQNLSTRWISSV